MPKPGEYEPLALRLERHSIPEPNSGCTLWFGASSKGYGYIAMIADGRRVNRLAHVTAYELARGPVPAGLVLDHKCRTRCCINPNHLEPVTFTENVLRGVGPTAQNARMTHCHAGHKLAGENLFVNSRGSRVCRACQRARQNAWNAQKREADAGRA
jgi:hypothetical protein